MEEEDEEETVAQRLARIQAAQRKRPSTPSSSDSDEANDGGGKKGATTRPKNAELFALMQEGFSQDLSQSSTLASAVVPQRLVRLLPLTTTVQQKQHYTPIAGGTSLSPLHPNGPALDYRDDEFSPFAVGGMMYNKPPHRPPPPVPQRGPSPAVTSRAASPAVSAASESQQVRSEEPKKKKNKKTLEEIAEEEALQKDIDIVVDTFKEEYRPYIQCVEEMDVKNPEDKEFYSVAKWLKVKKPNIRTLDLAMFNSKQIRKLATNSGIKGGGNMTLFQARKKIAQAINMGTVYDDTTIGNPKTTQSERKVNTLMRLLNVCFHKTAKDKFIDLNDAKKRADYEAAHGGNPIKHFWKTVSESTNDSEKNSVFGIVLEAQLGEDERLRDMVLAGVFNLNDFTIQTFLSAQQNVNDVMKAREACLRGGLRVSGHHSNDLWTYATNSTFTKLRKNSTPVPAAAVYYCHVLCLKHPEIDGKFAAFLDEKLKSDSEIDMVGDAGVQEGSSSSKRKASIDSLVASLVTTTSDMSKVMQAKQQEKVSRDERAIWDEYFVVSERFLKTKEDASRLPLLCNMAVRLRMLEAMLAITTDQSVTNGVDGIPPIAEVVTVATSNTNDSTSDITTQQTPL